MIIWFSQAISWLIPVEGVIEFLSEHPLLLLALVLLLAGIVLSFLKKVLKVAFLLLAIFIAANAVLLYFAETEWGRKGKLILEEGTKKAEELVRQKGKELLKDGIREIESVGDSALKKMKTPVDSVESLRPAE